MKTPETPPRKVRIGPDLHPVPRVVPPAVVVLIMSLLVMFPVRLASPENLLSIPPIPFGFSMTRTALLLIKFTMLLSVPTFLALMPFALPMAMCRCATYVVPVNMPLPLFKRLSSPRVSLPPATIFFRTGHSARTLH